MAKHLGKSVNGKFPIYRQTRKDGYVEMSDFGVTKSKTV